MKKRTQPPYSSADILEAAGISQRTLTRWFAHGILALPRRGARVPYGEEHMLRARAAGTLRTRGLRLAAIRARLDGASRAQLEAWAKGDLSEVAAAEAATYPATRCEHVEIAPGLTLVIRADCDPAVRRMASEMYARYGPAARR